MTAVIAGKGIHFPKLLRTVKEAMTYELDIKINTKKTKALVSSKNSNAGIIDN